MTTRLTDYVASGYFLSRCTETPDPFVPGLRRVSMAQDHSQRRFFPDAWALSWCTDSRERRAEQASVFGIREDELHAIMTWADASFGVTFGPWNVLYTLDAAREAARTHLHDVADLELWGVGLHQSLVNRFCEAATPPPPPAGHAPTGASGVCSVTCRIRAPLADGATVLGHELLLVDGANDFNGPESLHVTRPDGFLAPGVVPNADGLIESFDDALACCRHVAAGLEEAQEPSGMTFYPWLIVRYEL